MKILIIIAIILSCIFTLMILAATCVTYEKEGKAAAKKFIPFLLVSLYISVILIIITSGGYLNV